MSPTFFNSLNSDRSSYGDYFAGGIQPVRVVLRLWQLSTGQTPMEALVAAGFHVVMLDVGHQQIIVMFCSDAAEGDYVRWTVARLPRGR